MNINKDQKKVLDPAVNWHDITEGGIIAWAGNAEQYETGSWRSDVPFRKSENCKNCMLCFYSCPDSSIRVTDDAKMDGFDMDHCKGCGVCAKKCPFDAIGMKSE